MPPVGVLIGGVNFTKLDKEAVGNVPAVTIK